MLHKFPFLIAIFGMVLGIFIAILFGVNEGIFKNKIKQDLQQNVKIQMIEDEAKKSAKLSKEADKNWRYYQRFHFHSTGIASMSLALLIFLSFVGAPGGIKLVTAYSTAISGFLYPFIWLFAAMYGPIMGRHEAKESFVFFGWMGGVFLLATLVILALAIKFPLRLTLQTEK